MATFIHRRLWKPRPPSDFGWQIECRASKQLLPLASSLPATKDPSDACRLAWKPMVPNWGPTVGRWPTQSWLLGHTISSPPWRITLPSKMTTYWQACQVDVGCLSSVARSIVAGCGICTDWHYVQPSTDVTSSKNWLRYNGSGSRHSCCQSSLPQTIVFSSRLITA
jgi:hypothetical protein